MALYLSSRIGSSVLTRRRIPFVGAFCVLSLGISSFSSSSFKPGCAAQSLSFAPLLRLKAFRSNFILFLCVPLYEHWRLLLVFRSRFSSKASSSSSSSSSIKMEESSKTVPSIVVYVTVPNREAGYYF